MSFSNTTQPTGQYAAQAFHSDAILVMAANARLEPIESALAPGPFPDYGRGESAVPQPVRQPALPPIPTQASNLFQSAVAFVGDGCGVVDDATYRQRIAICNTCDRRNGNRCTACGCWINVKARGRIFACPLGRWQ